MPPWPPDTTYTRFIHENKITPAEKSAILNWISGGAVKGDTTLAPAAPFYSPYKLNGTPNLELRIPTFTSNAVSSDSYDCFSIPTNLTQDRILRAYEIIPGNPLIVHHVVVNVDTNGTTTTNTAGNCFSITGDFSIGGFAPGAPPTVFPGQGQLKMGIRIKAGSKLVLQLHYPQGTAGQVDSTKIRLYFYPTGETGVRNVYVGTPLQNWSLNIPANTVKTYSATTSNLGAGLPISILAAFPHSHKVATQIVNYAHSGIDTTPIIRIKQWQFDQQGYYTFNKMPKINPTDTIFSSHVYDNTTNNPNNPNPVHVYAGPNTSNEMFFDSFQWLIYQNGDELIDINNILASDSLLQPFATGIKEQAQGKNSFSASAFPNPFENTVKIRYNLEKSSKVNIEVLSVMGTLVRSLNNSFESSGTHEVIWDGKNSEGSDLPSGTYFYVIKSGGKQSYGKLSLLPSKH